MIRKNSFGVAGLIVVAAIGIPGCSFLFSAAPPEPPPDPVDNVNFDGCFGREIDNPDGSEQQVALSLTPGMVPVVTGLLRIIERDSAQSDPSQRDYSLSGEATVKGEGATDGEAKLTATASMGTPGDPQEITVTRDLGAGSARVDFPEADGGSFTGLLSISCPQGLD